MSGLNPTAPSQPDLSDAYTARDNNAEKDAVETRQGEQNRSDVQEFGGRIPQTQSTSQSDATPSSLGYGIRGAPAGEEAKGKTSEDVGRHNELDGEQMAAPGEGKVASAVDRKPGASGAEQGLEMDLDRKKEEQREARGEIDEKKGRGVDVAGVLGQRSAPADPTT